MDMFMCVIHLTNVQNWKDQKLLLSKNRNIAKKEISEQHWIQTEKRTKIFQQQQQKKTKTKSRMVKRSRDAIALNISYFDFPLYGMRMTKG